MEGAEKEERERPSLGLDNGYNITIAVREAWRLGEGDDGGEGGWVKELTKGQSLVGAWVSLRFVGWYLG